MIESFIYFIGQGVDGEELFKNNTVFQIHLRFQPDP